MERIAANQQTRRRAVRLKKEAILHLNHRLEQEWSHHPGSGKLTRQEKARLLGVSLVTSQKILSGSGVDRPTLTLVYKNLGLTWDNSYCEPIHLEFAPDDLPDEAGLEETPLNSLDDPPRKRSWPGRWIFASALAGSAALLISGFHLLGPRTNMGRDWEGRYLAEVKSVIQAYRQADYLHARSRLAKAIEIARLNSDALALSETLMLAGDLAAANGDYETAKLQYEKALIFKNELGAEVARPVIWNALGEIETALHNYEQAELYFRDCLKDSRKYSDVIHIVQACRGLGTVSHYQGDLGEALKWYEMAEQEMKGMDEADLHRDIQARRALVWRDQGLYPEAMAALQECLAHWQNQAHPRWIARTQLQVATVYFRQKDRPSASMLVDSSLAAYTTLRDQAGMAECKRMLGAKSDEEFGLAITSTSFLPDDTFAVRD